MDSSITLLGWREWAGLPALNIDKIKAKIDTGARTSALHAFRVATYREHGGLKVSFDIHPLQYNTTRVITCTADVIDIRWVTDSGGHREQRYVIQTELQLGQASWPIEVTLTDRDEMRFRLLLGRTALIQPGQFVLINPALSYLQGKRKLKQSLPCEPI